MVFTVSCSLYVFTTRFFPPLGLWNLGRRHWTHSSVNSIKIYLYFTVVCRITFHSSILGGTSKHIFQERAKYLYIKIIVGSWNIDRLAALASFNLWTAERTLYWHVYLLFRVSVAESRAEFQYLLIITMTKVLPNLLSLKLQYRFELFII